MPETITPRIAAQEIHRACSRGFRYAHDQDQYGIVEDWRTHVDSVRSGDVWRDDCDGFALTAAVMALEDYVLNPGSITINYCEVKGVSPGGHLVCGIRDNGDTYVIDNRYRYIVDAGELGYRWVSHMRCSNPGVWLHTRIRRTKTQA